MQELFLKAHNPFFHLEVMRRNVMNFFLFLLLSYIFTYACHGCDLKTFKAAFSFLIVTELLWAKLTSCSQNSCRCDGHLAPG